MFQEEEIPYIQVLTVRIMDLDQFLQDVQENPINTASPVLNLSGKGVTRLLPSFGRLTSLTELTLSFNYLRNLPITIGNLENLELLCLSENALRDLPPTFVNLTKLKSLNLYANCLRYVPEALKELRALERLYLDSNPFREVIEFQSNWKSLTTLSILDCRQGSISPTVNNLAELRTFNMGGNSWKTLPDLEGLVSLRNLSINDMSDLETLPESLSQLESLTFLSCSNSKLCCLPSWIGSLTSLEFLEVGNNHLEELPSSIGEMRSLQTLRLHDNKLTSVPKTLGKISELKFLELDHNPIESLPTALFDHNPNLILTTTGIDKLRLSGEAQPQQQSPKKFFDPQTLAILSARKLVPLKGLTKLTDLPKPCIELIESAKECSTLHCRGVFIRGGGKEGRRMVEFGSSLQNWKNSVAVDTHTCDYLCTDEKPLNMS